MIVNIAVFAIFVLPFQVLQTDLPWGSVNYDMMLHYWTNENFEPYQLVTHFFHHASIGHLFFNMLMLYFFGPVIENRLGANRFLILYFVAAAGAVALYTGELYWQIHNASPNAFRMNPADSRMLGASGAISGVLAAFAVFYPRQKLQFLFIPVPIAAMYMITGIFLLDLFLGVMNFSFDNTARFAHLGGAIAGALIAWAWKGDGLPPGIQRWD